MAYIRNNCSLTPIVCSAAASDDVQSLENIIQLNNQIRKNYYRDENLT